MDVGGAALCLVAHHLVVFFSHRHRRLVLLEASRLSDGWGPTKDQTCLLSWNKAIKWKSER